MKLSTLNTLILILFVILLFVIYIGGKKQAEFEKIIPEESPEYTQEYQQLAANEDQKIADNYNHSLRLHWPSLPISYRISNESECRKETDRINSALKAISNETNGLIQFQKSNEEKLDIIFQCQTVKIDVESDIETRGETKLWTYSDNQNLIHRAEIILYNTGGENRYSSGCTYPDVEVHEILHAFGFAHNSLTSSIMRPYTRGTQKDCVKRIDSRILETLKETYNP